MTAFFSSYRYFHLLVTIQLHEIYRTRQNYSGKIARLEKIFDEHPVLRKSNTAKSLHKLKTVYAEVLESQETTIDELQKSVDEFNRVVDIYVRSPLSAIYKINLPAMMEIVWQDQTQPK